MPQARPLPPAPPIEQVPDGDYSIRLLQVISYRQILCEITQVGYRGQRFLLPLPKFYLNITNGKPEIRLGIKPYNV